MIQVFNTHVGQGDGGMVAMENLETVRENGPRGSVF